MFFAPSTAPEAAAAGVAAVVADRRVADAALPRRADRRGPPAAAEPRLRSAASASAARQPGELRSRFEPDAVAVDEQHRQLVGAPRTTIASCPVSLPAMANWLDASASVSSPVSGDLATTANFALVVSGVPTSGENTNASGASGASGSTPAGCQPVQQPGAQARPRPGRRAAPARRARRACRSPPRRRRPRPAPVRSIHQAPYLDSVRPSSAQPPASADRKATVSPATSGNAARG